MKSSNTGNLKTVVFVSLLAVFCMSLSGCIQSQSVAATRYDETSSVSISDNTIKLVNNAFTSSFVGGDWYYQGAQAVKGSINAYIQIPQKLNMNEEQQRNYLKYAICPSADKTQLWQELQGVSLSVHIYTFNKRFTVHAECDNPVV